MEFGEVVTGAIALALTILFFVRWYRGIASSLAAVNNRATRIAMGLLPAAVLMIIAVTLSTLASFDVEGGWVLFYILIGFAWLYFGLLLMFAFFDLSWLDDALHRNNPAAAVAVICGGLGITLIYAGANVGDGPGWWCVFFAGGLGLAAWVIAGVIADHATGVFRRITVGRDIGCGIRTSGYLLASGLILGRACAGDWTSFGKTIVEFGDGWPVLILTAIFIGVELLIVKTEEQEQIRASDRRRVPLWASAALGIAFAAAAVLAVYLLPPLPENPEYHQAPQPIYEWSYPW